MQAPCIGKPIGDCNRPLYCFGKPISNGDRKQNLCFSHQIGDCKRSYSLCRANVMRFVS